jgi:hypothetical protein
LIYGADSAFVQPWVKEREALLFADQIAQGITHLHRFVDLAPIIHYFQQNHARMLYGTYRQRGYCIGSGAIESAGKQLTAGRIKGPGMRCNVADLNALSLYAVCFWNTPGRRIGMRKPSWPPNCQKFDMHPIGQWGGFC